jgi:hypothetical protein
MRKYSVFYNRKLSSESSYVIVKQSFNVWFLVFGPIWFLFHKMWFHFFVFSLILLFINLLYIYEISSFSVVRFCSLAISLYLAIDFTNLKESNLYSKGYEFIASDYYHKNLISRSNIV